jgi:hypothetical protein
MEKKDSVVVHLPISIIGDKNVNIYNYCVMCAKEIGEEHGIICLEFCEMYWGVRIMCFDCYCYNDKKKEEEEVYCTNKKITNIFGLLQPIINECAKINYRGCLVCEKRNCKDDICKKTELMLYKNETEIILEHFYRLELDVLSVFVKDEPCAICQVYVGKKYFCAKCKLRGYCGKTCKKKDVNHVCIITEYKAIWHNLLEKKNIIYK